MPKIVKMDNAQDRTDNDGHDRACLSEEDMVRYLFHPLTKDERFRIEKHITDCDICYDAVQGAREFKSEDEWRSHTDSLRQAVKQKYGNTNSWMHKNRLTYYSVAALVLISFSSIGYWMLHEPHGRVADEFIRPYSNMIPLSRGENRQTLLEEAMAAYEAESYTEAKDKLDRFLKESPEHEAANLYCGICALLNGEGEAALPHFDKASGSKDRRISEAAQWYRALVYVKLDRIAEAKELLQTISQGGGYFSPSALELMKRIDK